jgi:hypothetical protein
VCCLSWCTTKNYSLVLSVLSCVAFPPGMRWFGGQRHYYLPVRLGDVVVGLRKDARTGTHIFLGGKRNYPFMSDLVLTPGSCLGTIHWFVTRQEPGVKTRSDIRNSLLDSSSEENRRLLKQPQHTVKMSVGWFYLINRRHSNFWYLWYSMWSSNKT